MILSGRVWKFGDQLHSSHFLSGRHDALGRAGKFEQLSRHILEDANPAFVDQVRPGDLLVVGAAFGTGKHLDGLIHAFRTLGIAAILGKGFSAAWERDSINLGLPALVYPELYEHVQTGEELQLDLRGTLARNLTRGTTIAVHATDAGLLALLEAGSIAAYTARRLGIVDRPKAGAHTA
ncbi:hypothetical protein FYA96_02870 [Bordetella parapertussis]|uniref:hypothetical protein n=1 Tax=Bordetella parapertussis TaxID=519 RepID=UPI001298735B|nr:hypothetical protein [Bordetella parapertussis]QGD19730.1 hypothetical protein FYA96_02870 [Bordetella parapertussis]